MNRLYLPTSIFVLAQLFFQIVPLVYSFVIGKSNIFTWKALLANSLALTIFILFVYLFNKKYKQIKNNLVIRKDILFLTSTIIVLFYPFVLLLHSFVSGVNPFLVSLQGGTALDVAMAREAYSKELSLIHLLIFTIYEQILPMMFIPITIAQYYQQKKKRYLVLSLMFFIFILISGMFSGAKLPPLIGFAFLVFSIAIIKNKRALFFYLKISFIGAFLLGLVAVITYGTNGGLSQVFAIIKDLIGRRILQVHSYAMTSYFEVFPNISDFLYGKGIRLVSILMGEPSFQLANFMYLVKYDGGVLATGWLNSGYIAEAWADFGWLGIIFYPIFLALIFSKINKVIIHHYNINRPVSVFFNVTSAYLAFDLAISSMFSSTLILFMLIIIFLRYYLFYKKTLV